MLDDVLYKLRSLRLASPFSASWADMTFYWHTWNKGPIVFLLVATSVIGAISYIAHLSLEEKRDIRNLMCLALNVYHEARGEPQAGQVAVAKVTINRVQSKHYPNTICEVVYQSNWDRIRKRYVSAFSWTELPYSKPTGEAWQQAWGIAKTVYENPNDYEPKSALFYHAKSIKPKWAKYKKPVARIGEHIFY
ncbi:MAG: cell wall hydrolase [Gammaproteobacteria bacterium]|nr:cell wall hydrolase [Gammaproteobacteria bacterium]